MNLEKAVVHEIHEKHEKNQIPIGLFALTRWLNRFLAPPIVLFVSFVFFVDNRGF